MNWKSGPQPQDFVSVNGVTFTHDDLFRVVGDFYSRVREDSMLKEPFSSVVDWEEHVRRLTHFWWIRFGGKAYLFSHYDPVSKHFYAGFNQEFLDRWLSLFRQTLENHLKPEQAELWKIVSERMGESLMMKNEMFKKSLER